MMNEVDSWSDYAFLGDIQQVIVLSLKTFSFSHSACRS
jgi:hypothetical protein